MFTMASDALQVSVLDPERDRERMGPRYCTGGYIFQVEDVQGPLLSGPTYPESFNWFDGQGIPDSFAPGAIRDASAPSTEALIPGIGLCDTSSRAVLSFCDWEVRQEVERIAFRTDQSWGGSSFTLWREIETVGRVVVSTTRVTNTGGAQLPVRWFPHPFYPLPGGSEICRLPPPVRIPEGTTYSVGDDGYLRCSDFAARQSAPVRCGSGAPLAVMQRHPVLGLVSAHFSFPAGHVLVWGNENTFSFEPYLEQTVGARDTLDWRVEYHF